MPILTLPEYKKFLEEEVLAKKLGFYEKFCKTFSFFKFPTPRELEKKYKEEIEFTHLSLTPSEIFSSSLIFSFLLIFSSIIPAIFFGVEFLFMMTMIAGIVLFFLLTYPSYNKFLFRSKASSEMMLGIVYLVIAMRIYKSLDKAVAFVAKNLTGPLGRDFKEVLWDVYSGKKYSISQALEEMSVKWREESEEFSEALSLISGSTSVGGEKNLEEALNLMLTGTVVRMESYARRMKTPLSIINMFGILLPLLALVTFPVLFLMLPEMAKPHVVSFLYNVLLFSVIYLLIRKYLFLRPYSFHQPEIMKVGKMKEWKKKSIFVALTVFILLFSIFSFLLFSKPLEIFNEAQYILSIFLTSSFFIPIILYNFLLYFKVKEKNELILQIESEFPATLEELSTFLRTGVPIESGINDTVRKIGNLKIKVFFEKILSNIKLGLPFFNAIFDEKIGAIKEFPSKMIHAIMGVIVEISTKGSIFLSDALRAISRYMNDAKIVGEKTKSIMEEITSNIRIQCLVLAPVTGGIIVGLTVMVLAIFFYFGGNLQSIRGNLSGLGPLQDVTTGGIFSLANFSSLIPVPFFQIIVGIYLLEVTWLMAYLYGEINYGDDEISKCYNYLTTFLIVMVIYIVLTLVIYFGVKAIINIEELAKVMV